MHINIGRYLARSIIVIIIIIRMITTREHWTWIKYVYDAAAARTPGPGVYHIYCDLPKEFLWFSSRQICVRVCRSVGRWKNNVENAMMNAREDMKNYRRPDHFSSFCNLIKLRNLCWFRFLWPAKQRTQKWLGLISFYVCPVLCECERARAHTNFRP